MILGDYRLARLKIFHYNTPDLIRKWNNMSEALTYDSLLSDVVIYAERSDTPFVTQVPRFIMMAENRLASEVRGLGTQKYVTSTLSGPTIAKPNRWRETISLNLTVAGERVFLQPRTYDYCRTFCPDTTTVGVPRYYADYEYEHFILVPTPNSGYTFELAYYERPDPLSSDNQTNWFTQYAPQLLLYATLLEAQPFLKRPERIAEFQSLYDRALQGIAQETSRRISGDRASSSRSGE